MGYQFNPFTGKFDKVGTGGGGGGGGDTVVVDVFTISAPEAAAKEVTLTSLPASASSVLALLGGVGQTPGDDFSIVGNILSWASLGMDALPVVAGDVLIVIYGA